MESHLTKEDFEKLKNTKIDISNFEKDFDRKKEIINNNKEVLK